jgi:hypothetical protein
MERRLGIPTHTKYCHKIGSLAAPSFNGMARRLGTTHTRQRMPYKPFVPLFGAFETK